MKTKLVVLLCVVLFSAIDARAVVLPDSCGDDKVTFDVKTEKNQPMPAGPAEGNAQIIFMENENHMVGPFIHATVRFGIDGAWVGADNGNSYLVATVNPGLHHLCASWQSTTASLGEDFDLTSFTAEPGMVYYFGAAVTVESRGVVTFALSQLNKDQGKYRLKYWKLSSSKPK
jgi:hypothetical protein